MNVLLTNDDGILAPGLEALLVHFSKTHAVTVIAPDRENSGISHAITLRDPIRAHRRALKKNHNGYAVSGTPADCVKLGINEILSAKPDLVVAGINCGANVGINLNYSGTVAAAREAALYGLPAMAVAVESSEAPDYDDIARFVVRLGEKVHQCPMPLGTFLNVNVPKKPMNDIRGVRICGQEISLFYEQFEKRTDPRNRIYYWQGCDSQAPNQDDNKDVSALCNHYISITPIKSDMTDYTLLETLKSWSLEIKKAAT